MEQVKSDGKVLVVSSDIMGDGDIELGGILIRSFFHTLVESEILPNSIIFFNTGVKLVVSGSPVLEDLKFLEQKNIDILACGTCLGHFNLKDKISVGRISNMYEISETMLKAGNIINL